MLKHRRLRFGTISTEPELLRFITANWIANSPSNKRKVCIILDETRTEKQLARKRKYQRHKRMMRLNRLLLIASVFLLFCAIFVMRDFRQMSREPSFKLPDIEIQNLAAPDDEPDRPTADTAAYLDCINSPNAILVDLTEEKVLEKQNSSERIYPASLTKIMTAILAIENTSDFDKTLTFPSDIFEYLYLQNASQAGFQPGEEVKYKDALYGILLPSGAECCLAYADSIAGSEAAFVEMMNQKADELGMKNTHFCNTTGLHEDDHYSTVEDISILLSYALKNDVFREVFTSSRHSIPPSNYHPDGFTFYSTMFQCMDTTEVTGGEILGGKTGYTGEAGLCLASLARVNDQEYILVTAHADGTHKTKQFHVMDALSVYSRIGSVAKN